MTTSGFEKFKISSAGAKALLRSEGVRADLQRRAENVSRAAEASSGIMLTADSYIGKGRAGATVFGVPIAIERSRRILGGAIDAAGN